MPPKKRKHRQEKAKSPAVPKAPPKEQPIRLNKLPPVSERAAPLVILSERPRAIVVLFVLGLLLFFLFGLLLIVIGQFRGLDAYVRPAFPWIVTILGILCCLPALGALIVYGLAFIKTEEKKLTAAFGAIFLVVLLIVALLVPNPSESSMLVFRVTLALAAACVGGVIPGVLQIKNRVVRATSASAFFAAVFFFNPDALTKLIN